ncbi:hypothetical protein WT02_27340 [Burkholderia stagnalis]|nr:hypothetical protein WT02_27340 [Burkholderia stagnalis]KVL97143.1 hypothetical protein WT03_10565 [Burkholderia stagnalis]KVM09477.1 hypothetical protein WT04_17730 [Burkholderia stagnalis]
MVRHACAMGAHLQLRFSIVGSTEIWVWREEIDGPMLGDISYVEVPGAQGATDRYHAFSGA